MRRWSTLFALFGAVAFAAPPDAGFEARVREAERIYHAGEFRLAHERYEALEAAVPDTERRWVRVRLADTQWRAETAEAGPGTSSSAARRELEEIARGRVTDRAWAEAQESLGDLLGVQERLDLDRRRPYYQNALAWWAECGPEEEAALRFFPLIGKALDLDGQRARLVLPVPLARAALQYAFGAEEVALANLLLAHALVETARREIVRSEEVRVEAASAFEAALAAGKRTRWYGTALLGYAGWCEWRQKAEGEAPGGTFADPDPQKAEALYERALAELPRESALLKDVPNRLYFIRQRSARVSVDRSFLPGSEVLVKVSHHNVPFVDLDLYRVDLAESEPPVDKIDLARAEKVLSCRFDTNDTGDRRRVEKEMVLPGPIPEGAYVLVASSAAGSSRELILVTGLTLFARGVGTRTLVFCTSARDGRPVEGALVRMWKSELVENRWAKRRESAISGEDGIAWLGAKGSSAELWASRGDGNALCNLSGTDTAPAHPETRFHALTDRPVARPGETVAWRILVRKSDGSRRRTPSGERVSWRITGPKDRVVREGVSVLDAFGSAWGKVTIEEAWPTGEYQFVLSDPNVPYGTKPTLFRVGERAAELHVSVTPLREGERLRTFLRGQPALLDIAVTDEAGVPVGDAEVELAVWEREVYGRWETASEFPWYRDSRWDAPEYSLYGAKLVARRSLRTGEDGKARLEIPTVRGGPTADLVVEATVRDASGRTGSAQGKVRVSSRRSFAVLRTARSLYLRGEKVRATLLVRDALKQPIAASGTVWLARLVADPWRPIEPRTSWRIATGPGGTAEIAFNAEDVGSFFLEFRDDADTRTAAAFTAFSVGEPDVASSAAWPERGVVVVESRDYRPGEKVPVLISAREPGANVLVAVEGEVLDRVQLVRMTGTSRIVEIPLTERDVPNVTLHVLSHAAGGPWESLQLFVPPRDRFLHVSVETDRQRYRPGEEVSVRLTTRDGFGTPVGAQVALVVRDDALSPLDRSGDPRQVFHSRMRNPNKMSFAFPAKRYEDLVFTPDGRLVDRRRETERVLREMAVWPRRDEGRFAPQPPQPTPGPMLSLVTSPEPTEGGGPGAPDGDFVKTAYWKPDVVTGSDGRATVRFRLPDSPATWKLIALASTTGDEVGIGGATIAAAKPFHVRLQAPCTLVVGDVATISARLENHGGESRRLLASLDAGILEGQSIPVRISLDEKGRVDWRLTARRAGEARVEARVKDAVDEETDARTISIRDTKPRARVYRTRLVSGPTGSLSVELPKRDARVTVSVSTGLAAALRESAAELAGFEWGSADGVLGRFLPALLVRHASRGNGSEKAPSVAAGELERLLALRNPDGGWGWWKGMESDTRTTAHVLAGLSVAVKAGLPVPDEPRSRAAAFLESRLDGEGRPDAIALSLWAISEGWSAPQSPPSEVRGAFDRLFQERRRLDAGGRALLALAASRFGWEAGSAALLAGLGVPEGIAATGGEVESTAFVLLSLLELDPASPLVEEAERRLLESRKGDRWTNTRDSALAVLALSRLLAEEAPRGRTGGFDLLVNGRRFGHRAGAPLRSTRFGVPARFLREGRNEISIRRRGAGPPLLVSITAEIPQGSASTVSASAGFSVARTYLRGGAPIASGDVLAPDGRLEAVVTLESGADREYVVVEDPVPGGLRAFADSDGVEIRERGGSRRLRARWDVREGSVAAYVPLLPAGIWELRYALRAETPGAFHVSAVSARAAYAPDIHAIGAEERITVAERLR